MLSEPAFAYHEDVATRSIISKSAHRKANSSAVAKLGNKPMSNKEIMSKNGPILTLPETNCLMEYCQFMKLGNDLKIEFVNGMMDRYDISLKYISKYLFNKGDDGL